MSIVAVLEQWSLLLTVLFVLWVLAAIVAARRLGVFQRRSVLGPPRLAPHQSLWNLLRTLLLGLFVAIFGPAFYVLAMGTPSKADAFVLQLFFSFLGVAAILAATVLTRPKGIQRIGLDGAQLSKGIAQGGVGIFILLPLVYIVSFIVVLVWRNLGWAEPSPHIVLQLLSQTHDRRLWLTLVLTALIAAPLLEELLFRGLLQTILSSVLTGRRVVAIPVAVPPDQAPAFTESILERRPVAGRWFAIAITALLFALVHRESAFVAPLFLLALGLGYAYERTGNLWVPITMHATFNGWQLLVFLAASKAGM